VRADVGPRPYQGRALTDRAITHRDQAADGGPQATKPLTAPNFLTAPMTSRPPEATTSKLMARRQKARMRRTMVSMRLGSVEAGACVMHSPEHGPRRDQAPCPGGRVEDLQQLQDRTGLAKTDIVNRAISLYEFIEEAPAGRDLAV
jgi:hypothetical protein